MRRRDLRRGIYAFAAVMLLLVAAAVIFDLYPESSCDGRPGESDLLDNPNARRCDWHPYDLALVVLTPLSLLLASLVGGGQVAARIRGTRRRQSLGQGGSPSGPTGRGA